MRDVMGLNVEDAVQYHYGKFPPQLTNLTPLIKPLARAAASLARYDQMLKGMHSSDILLAPLRSQEAVISSRMEGTVSTLDEVLRYEADQDENPEVISTNYRSEAIEVYLYGRALRHAQQAIKDGAPISAWLLRSAHKELLSFGRGAHMSPGELKTEQNYLADKIKKKILFTPISPELLNDGLDRLFSFIENDNQEILIKTALAHLEFEALHPFKDGNGRIGRMIIPLMLWKYGAISEPHFYVSEYFEDRKDEYIDKMREVSQNGSWIEWIMFFLDAIENQATRNLNKAEEIKSLYEEMKVRFRDILSSQWGIMALDFIFTKPVFRNNVFISRSDIPKSTAHRFVRLLSEEGLLETVVPSSGRRPALYSFEPLMRLVRG